MSYVHARDAGAVPPKPRDTRAGIFHVWTHCVWAVPRLYRDDVDRFELLRNLARAADRPGWTCLLYVLMTSHYHLIVEVDDGVLPRAMHAINLAYARHHNLRYSLHGHAQSWRYGSRRIDDDSDLISTYRYVANNPVDAGLCSTPADWPWSSYGGTIGLAEPATFVDPSRVLSCFDGPRCDPRAALRTSVETL